MKIVHVVEPFSSGITTFIIHLVNGMPQFENVVIHGARVGVDDQEKVRSRFDKSTRFILWKSAGRSIHLWNDLKATFELYKIFKREKPDVIHLHSSKAGFIGRLVGTCFKARIIYTPNGLAFARKDVSNITRRAYVFLEWMASKLSGKIICCSKSEMNFMSSAGIECDYINNGTIISERNANKDNEDKKIITIGCLAIITEQKDPVVFNKIASHFLLRDDVEFVWIGDGHLRHELKSKNIKVTGWLDSSEKEKWFSSLDIYLSCSLWEGLPFSVLEAMNNKQCLLLRNCVGNVDLVIDNINGFQFENEVEGISKLENLLSSRDRIIEMGEASFQILSEKFDVKNMVTEYQLSYIN